MQSLLSLNAVTTVTECSHYCHWMQSLLSLNAVTTVTECSHYCHYMQSLLSLNAVTTVTECSHYCHWMQSLLSLNAVTTVTECSHYCHWMQSLMSLNAVIDVTKWIISELSLYREIIEKWIQSIFFYLSGSLFVIRIIFDDINIITCTFEYLLLMISTFSCSSIVY